MKGLKTVLLYSDLTILVDQKIAENVRSGELSETRWVGRYCMSRQAVPQASSGKQEGGTCGICARKGVNLKVVGPQTCREPRAMARDNKMTRKIPQLVAIAMEQSTPLLPNGKTQKVSL